MLSPATTGPNTVRLPGIVLCWPWLLPLDTYVLPHSELALSSLLQTVRYTDTRADQLSDGEKHAA